MDIGALRTRLGEPVDPASFVVLRVGFGLLAAFAAIRFVAKGWVQELLIAPELHFPWVPGLQEPAPAVLYGLFAAQVLAGIGIAAGFKPRACLVVWLGAFGTVELLDKALYLNHYVLFTLLGLWLLVSPVHKLRLKGGPGLPTWSLWLLRFQLATVYLWAGLAKLNADWLLRAQPLDNWLSARAGLPVVGPYLDLPQTAFAMSWAGAAYDLCIPFLLLFKRTRVLGLVLVAGFHLSVGWLFPIGIFPWLMMLGATLFLDPAWPRRWAPGGFKRERAQVSRGWTAALMAIAALLLLFPARSLWLPGPVAWTEAGYRLSWRVMLNEKTGLVDFRVVEPATGKVWKVHPASRLSEIQHQQMRTQPDMIRDFALQLQREHAAEGRTVQVYADSFASLNGRPSQRMVNPHVDLTQPLPALWDQGWILPLEDAPRDATAASR